MVPTAGGAALRLTYLEKADVSPAGSPDGRYLAFISDRSGQRQVWLFKAEGGGPYQLTKIEADIETFIWLPNSSKIVSLTMDAKSKEKLTGKRLLSSIVFNISEMGKVILMSATNTFG